MIRGFPRPTGAIGARNEVLVLPSVVCSSHVAHKVAGSEAVAISHPHGCAHVGDDALHAAAVFAGIAANPNVAGVVIVGLGCETIQGEQLAQQIATTGQRVEFCSIQGSGGSTATVETGRELVTHLRSAADAFVRAEVPDSALVIGLDAPDAPFAPALRSLLAAAGARIVEPTLGPGLASHAELAAEGAQILISVCPSGEAPRGFAICPVISVAEDYDTYQAMPDDFDVLGAGPAEEIAQQLFDLIHSTFDGHLVAAERRGAREFELRRLTRSM